MKNKVGMPLRHQLQGGGWQEAQRQVGAWTSPAIWNEIYSRTWNRVPDQVRSHIWRQVWDLRQQQARDT